VKIALRKPPVQIAAAIGSGLVIALAGWLLLVSPQRSKDSELKTSIEAVKVDIETRRAALNAEPRIELQARASDLYRLTKAVPDRTDTTGIIFDLGRLASSSGVSVESITPAAQIVGQGYNVQPLNVVVQGRYGELSDFVSRLRALVTVRQGKLHAHGRLFSVDTVQLQEADGDLKFPAVKATLTVGAYVYSGQPTPGTGTAGETDSTTTSATPSNEAAAAGVTG
jgi:Tfp pilus assembly protein PilO